ncbi:hypothetical protein JQM97_03400 [Prevotella hominis]|uniref:hypothetical protein n=1 Tax=Segatella hominis TaxID=2518605 RepID=UPI001F3D0A2E|nr:hypothetical protein [Segatella hominis]MCF2590004.1 hypothetical protein [Segatella hominis]
MAETINTQTTGYECVGIEKIEQTYEGLFDNKPNIITIYLTNGDTHQFKVMNGSQGVGIDRIEQRQTSTVSGGRNEFAIILTNGKEYTFSTYNGSGGSGSSGSFNQVLQQLNNLLMPSGRSYLYYNGSSFEWKSPDGSTGGGTADLSEYSWWGRRFDPESNSITGEMSGVTGIEFQSTNGETVIRKKLHLDNNGDLCFDGNFYATGGITALGSGGDTSGGSGVSLGTLLTKLNSDNPFPTDNGQVLTYDGNNFIWKIPTGSGGSTTGGIRIKRNGSTLKDSNGNVLSCTSINFKYGENWNSTPILINSDNEISVDLSVVANNGNGSSSSSNYPLTIYNGSSNTDYITYDGSSAAYLRFKSGFSISKVGLGYEISVSGGGSGSSGTTAGKLYFRKDTDSYSEAYWNGESNFRIIFGSGLNVTWDSNSQITLSATGGSGGSTSTSVSWTDVTNKPSTFTPSSHTHPTSEITNFASTVKGITVDNAKNAESANKLASSVYLWGNSFNGVRNIGSADSNKADLRYVNNIYTGDTFGLYNTVNGIDTSLLSIDNTPNISVAYGYRSNENAILSLFGNKTKIYTNGQNYHFDFVRNIFDVNSNQIHFGSETNGGKIYWDAANNAFKIEGNVYATGGITALGVSNNATTSNNVDFTFRSVTIAGNNNVQLTDDGLRVSELGDFGAWYKKDSIIMYNSADDDNCEIFRFSDSALVFDPQNYTYDIVFNKAISCNTAGNTLYIGNTNSAGFIEFRGRSTMKFEYNNNTYTFNVEEAVNQGILIIK